MDADAENAAEQSLTTPELVPADVEADDAELGDALRSASLARRAQLVDRTRGAAGPV